MPSFRGKYGKRETRGSQRLSAGGDVAKSATRILCTLFAQLKRCVYLSSSLSGGHLSPSSSGEQTCTEPRIQCIALQVRFQLCLTKGLFYLVASWLHATEAILPFKKEEVFLEGRWGFRCNG